MKRAVEVAKSLNAREVELVAAAAARLTRPWRPIKTAPQDGRQIIILWVDCDSTFNVDLAEWNDSAERFDRHGCGFFGLVGWMPRPKLPGPARLP